MNNDAKITIIGAGVVGLALAYQLSKKYKDIFVVEKCKKFGEETSSRSSEVIHSGIYYPSNSLKTKLCIEGRNRLYSFCEKYDVKYNKCGKLIVANTEADLIQLDILNKRAVENGVSGVKKISSEEVFRLEPNIKALGALLVSETGVIDSYGFMKKLENNSINNGVNFVYGSEVQELKKCNFGYELVLNEDEGGIFNFTSDIVINASGLNSDKISNLIGIKNPSYELHYCKGEYFAIGNGKNKLVKRLIYPVPNPNLTGLGVHLTVDVDKGAKLGPNAIYLKNRNIDYTVDTNHRDNFFQSAKMFLPFLVRPERFVRPML